MCHFGGRKQTIFAQAEIFAFEKCFEPFSYVHGVRVINECDESVGVLLSFCLCSHSFRLFAVCLCLFARICCSFCRLPASFSPPSPPAPLLLPLMLLSPLARFLLLLHLLPKNFLTFCPCVHYSPAEQFFFVRCSCHSRRRQMCISMFVSVRFSHSVDYLLFACKYACSASAMTSDARSRALTHSLARA